MTEPRRHPDESAKAAAIRPELARWARYLRAHWLPIGFLLLAGIVSAVQEWGLGPGARAVLVDWSSTNLNNLRGRPIEALVASAFVFEPELWSRLAIAVLALLALVDRFGNLRAGLLVGAGHVLATGVSQAFLATRIAAGRAPHTLAAMADVGPSYLVYTALSAVVLYGPGRGPRALALLYLLVNAPDLVDGFTDEDVTAVGHLTALLVGALLGAYARPRPPAAQDRRPGVTNPVS
ncbi:rhomboid-like protein [Embleya sp. AB8]|uniref:rhomboid-like protein n=1 Tax=Embleya sp. AB8 TaxID=3156304 RepID=UPI003C723A23